MPRKKAEASSSKKADKSATTEIKNDEESESTKMTRKSTRKKKSISYEDTAIDLSSTDDEKSKSKKKKASSKKRKKKEDDDEDSYVPESSENEDDVISVADSVEEVHSDASEEPKAKKSKKKKDSVSKTKSSKKEKTSKPKKTTKKKSSNIERTLTHHVTNESIVINCENLCPQFCPIIESREIKDDVVRSIIVQGSDNTSPNVEGMLSKTIFLNTKPEKERKNYVPEDRSMERPCIQVEIPFHQGTLIESRAENVKSDAQNFAILNIGAPVWAMDWVNKSPENSDQYAAIAPHTTHSAFHKCGKITSQHDLFRPLATSSSSAISDFDHCGKIQLWNFGKLTSKGQLKMKPSIDFYVEQNHGFIWDLKWMPNSYVADKRLGILGCACSDGTILIISIPLLSQINHDPTVHSSQNGALIIKLRSECYTSTQFDAENTLSNRIPYCLAWSPNCKYLLGGYNDGTVSLWKINSNASLQDNKPLLELVSTIQAHNHPTNDLAIRSMSWFDPALNENIFATCSNDGMNKIWDLRDIYYPYYSAANANRFWSTGIVFPEGSNALLCISHDGNIRQFDAVENAFQLLSTTDGPLWDISLCSSRASFVVCTATGRVEVMSLEQDSMGRKRRSVDTRVDDLLLQIDLVVDDDTSSEKQSLDKIAKSMKHAQLCYSLPYHVPTCESDNVKSYSKLPTKVKDIKLVPDERISIHRCLFHPSKSQHLRNWCLVGGYDGLVFAIPVPEHYSE